MQARSLRWKQLIIQAFKTLLLSPPESAAHAGAGGDSSATAQAEAAPAATGDDICGEGCRICLATDMWISAAIIGVLCASALLHAAVCALVRVAKGSRAPAWASGVLAGGKFEAAVALIVLPGMHPWTAEMCRVGRASSSRMRDFSSSLTRAGRMHAGLEVCAGWPGPTWRAPRAA